jgi:hypothetical protein
MKKITKESEFSKKINEIFIHLFGKENISEFEDKLFLNELIVKKFNEFILISIIFGGILSILLMIIMFYSDISIEKILVAGVLSFFVPIVIFYLIEDIIFERNKRKKEDLLAELILEISVFVDNISINELIKKVSEMDFGLLKKDFIYLNSLIENGSETKSAIEQIIKMNKSSELTRFYELLIMGSESGGNLSLLLSEMAEENLSNKAIIKERQAIMIITKYTLLLSSVLIIPIILGLIISLVSGFNSNFSSALELGLSYEQRQDLFNTTILGINIYIIEYALISSFFLSIQEGNKKNFFIYSIILVPLALIFFYIGQIL